MRLAPLICCFFLAVPLMAPAPRQPNLEAQRDAMKKLGFLTGKWVGEAHLLSAQGEATILAQTEDVQYKLDGLILTIEGVDRRRVDGSLALQAFAVASYDDERGSYRMRAFNDGRFLE